MVYNLYNLDHLNYLDSECRLATCWTPNNDKELLGTRACSQLIGGEESIGSVMRTVTVTVTTTAIEVVTPMLSGHKPQRCDRPVVVVVVIVVVMNVLALI